MPFDLENRHISLWGWGREGRATYDYVRRLYPHKPILLIDQHAPQGLPDDKNLSFITQKEIPDHLKEMDLVIKSPGISLYATEAERMRDAGAEITSATNIWFSHQKAGRIIAITGSNGKSTTSALLVHMLKSLGLNAALGGNIGIALLSLPTDADYYVVELSSYQTADLKYAPHVAVLLNLFPEHIQWHHSHEQYFHDKINLLKQGAVTNILNHRDPLTSRLVPRDDTSLLFNHPDGLHTNAGYIMNGPEKIGKASEMTLLGQHNLENLCAALSVCQTLGLDLVQGFKYATDFKGLEHRLENLGCIGPHVFINDSISTTPEATIAALKSCTGKTLTLIAGGQERGQDYETLARHLCHHPINALITVYETAQRIEDDIRQFCPEMTLEKAHNLEQAILKAKKITPKGGIILMSPAAPSYDAFTDFEQRGKSFKLHAQNKST